MAAMGSVSMFVWSNIIVYFLIVVAITRVYTCATISRKYAFSKIAC